MNAPESNRNKSVIIAGSGRCGTSCLAGLFDQTNFYHGDSLYPSNNANPKGFFENREINDLNEQIIVSSVISQCGPELARQLLDNYRPGQLWLTRLPMSLSFTPDQDTRSAIRALVAHSPFCFKDPRFSMTADVWLEEAPDTLMLCVFRDPATTVESILKECRSAPYLRDFRISVADAFALWRLTYLRLLRLYQNHENVYFIHYDNLFDAGKLNQLETLVDAKLDRSFPERELARSQGVLAPDAGTQTIYDILLTISEGDFGAGRISKIALVQMLEIERCLSVREICIEMLPLQKAEHLENFSDNIGANGFNFKNRQLHLKFQFVSLFKDVEIQRLWLSGTGATGQIQLTPKIVESPYVGQRHPDLVWSAQSRFIVDETVLLPDTFAMLSSLDLLAEVEGTHRKIGMIHINSMN